MSASAGQALEAAILANPDDLGAHAAYADWLIEQGDPRGEFIQVQLALEDPQKSAKERQQFQEREQDLLGRHRHEWLGPLAEFLTGACDIPEEGPPVQSEFSYAYRRGWLDQLFIPILTDRCAAALADAAQLRLLRTLQIRSLDCFNYYLDPPDDREFLGMWPLRSAKDLCNVTFFELGGEYTGANEDYGYNSLVGSPVSGEVLDLIETMPRLQVLHLNERNHLSAARLFGLKTLANLERLQFTLGEDCPLEVLAANPALKKLRYLLVHPQGIEEGGKPYVRRESVSALLQSPHLSALTHLRLHQTDRTDQICEDVVRSDLLPRLKELDLSYGSMTDAGARVLASCPELRHLETLKVSHNGLSEQGVEALAVLGIAVSAGTQHDPDDHHYLYEGDIE
jgi:uncharacterized protein (TIGR02996 family)